MNNTYEYTIPITGAELIAKGTVAIDHVPVVPEKNYIVIPTGVKIVEAK